MPKLEPMQSTSSRAGGRRARAMKVSSSLAEINVVPLVDVMLVLLVIFMVAAPMMQQGFPVDLPEARRSQSIEQQPVIVSVPVSFAQEQLVYLGDEGVPLANLPERIRQLIDDRPSKRVTMAADGDVPYRHIITVMDALKSGGVTSVDVQTQPVRVGRAR
jgi:biopolymer transport protein ExbD